MDGKAAFFLAPAFLSAGSRLPICLPVPDGSGVEATSAMILQSAAAAAGHLFSPAFRGVFIKTLGLTLLVLAALWLALSASVEWLALPWLSALLPQGLPEWTGWIGVFAGIAAAIGLALGLAFLIGPVTAIVSGFFLDEVAERVERADYPRDPPGQALPTGQSIVLSLKFFGLVVLGNLLALLLLLVPGVNLAAFFLVNGYLIGREFFEFAAMRHRPEAEAKALRRDNAGTVFLAGLVIAAFMAVPLLNLLTPLFACAMMVHLHKAVSRLPQARPAR